MKTKKLLVILLVLSLSTNSLAFSECEKNQKIVKNFQSKQDQLVTSNSPNENLASLQREYDKLRAEYTIYDGLRQIRQDYLAYIALQEQAQQVTPKIRAIDQKIEEKIELQSSKNSIQANSRDQQLQEEQSSLVGDFHKQRDDLIRLSQQEQNSLTQSYQAAKKQNLASWSSDVDKQKLLLDEDFVQSGIDSISQLIYMEQFLDELFKDFEKEESDLPRVLTESGFKNFQQKIEFSCKRNTFPKLWTKEQWEQMCTSIGQQNSEKTRLAAQGFYDAYLAIRDNLNKESNRKKAEELQKALRDGLPDLKVQFNQLGLTYQLKEDVRIAMNKLKDCPENSVSCNQYRQYLDQRLNEYKQSMLEGMTIEASPDTANFIRLNQDLRKSINDIDTDLGTMDGMDTEGKKLYCLWMQVNHGSPQSLSSNKISHSQCKDFENSEIQYKGQTLTVAQIKEKFPGTYDPKLARVTYLKKEMDLNEINTEYMRLSREAQERLKHKTFAHLEKLSQLLQKMKESSLTTKGQFSVIDKELKRISDLKNDWNGQWPTWFPSNKVLEEKDIQALQKRLKGVIQSVTAIHEKWVTGINTSIVKTSHNNPESLLKKTFLENLERLKKSLLEKRLGDLEDMIKSVKSQMTKNEKSLQKKVADQQKTLENNVNVARNNVISAQKKRIEDARKFKQAKRKELEQASKEVRAAAQPEKSKLQKNQQITLDRSDNNKNDFEEHKKHYAKQVEDNYLMADLRRKMQTGNGFQIPETDKIKPAEQIFKEAFDSLGCQGTEIKNFNDENLLTCLEKSRGNTEAEKILSDKLSQLRIQIQNIRKKIQSIMNTKEYQDLNKKKYNAYVEAQDACSQKELYKSQDFISECECANEQAYFAKSQDGSSIAFFDTSEKYPNALNRLSDFFKKKLSPSLPETEFQKKLSTHYMVKNYGGDLVRWRPKPSLVTTFANALADSELVRNAGWFGWHMGGGWKSQIDMMEYQGKWEKQQWAYYDQINEFFQENWYMPYSYNPLYSSSFNASNPYLTYYQGAWRTTTSDSES